MKKLILITLLFNFLAFSQEQAWVEAESLPPWASERHHPVTFSLNGTGYLLGGADPTSTTMMKDFYKYNPTLNNWTQAEDYPGPGRGFGYGVVVDGKAYVGMGIIEVNGQNRLGNDLWEYDPDTDSWTELTSLPDIESRYHPAFIGVNGKIFVGCGAGIDNVTQQQTSFLDDWWEYDIATDEWRELPNLPGPARHHPYYFGIGDDAYVVAGHGGDEIVSSHTGQPAIGYNDVYKWDSNLEQWETMNDLPAEGRIAGTQFSYGGKGYILSGEGEDHNLLSEGEFWEYDPAFDEWTQLESHPGNSRWAPGTFIVDGNLYLTSGRSSFRGQADVYEKDLWMYEMPEIASVEEKEEISFEVYPNPTSDFVNINGNVSGEFKVVVYDMAGEMVQEVKNTKNLNVSALNDGMYIISLKTTNETINKSFVKLGN